MRVLPATSRPSAAVLVVLLAALFVTLCPTNTAKAQRPDANAVTAIVGATLIDGNGGAAVPDAVVIVTGSRITAVGRRGAVTIPADAQVIDGKGKWLTPGFIDTNVHMSLYSSLESMVRYEDRFTDIAIEGTQLQLKYGFTSVRDRDRKSTRLNSSHIQKSRMPSSA